MSGQDAVEKNAGMSGLQELVKCPVCLDRLDRPKMLPCQHTFCLHCVQNCVETSGEVAHVRCAQCRAQVALGKEGVTGLPVNIYLQSVLDWLQANEGVDTAERCATCRTVCDVTTCQHCSSAYCRPCTERHLEELCRQLHYIRDQVDATKEKVRLRIKDFQDSCTDLKGDIRKEAEVRVQQVVVEERRLIEQVDRVYGQHEATWNGCVQRLETTEEELRAIIEKDFNDVGLPADKVALFLKFHSQASAVLEEVTKSDCPSVFFDAKNFSVSTETPKKAEDDGKEPVGVVEEPPLTPDLGQLAKQANAHSRFFRSRTFSVKSRLGVGLLQRPSGVAVSPWSSEIFVVSMDNHRVHVFDQATGRFRRSFGSAGEFLCPFGIALSAPERHVLVTDKWRHCIHVFNRHGRLVRQIGTKGRSPAHFRSPEAICVDQSGRIYVCDTCNNRIQVLSRDGAFLGEIGASDSGKKRTVFSDPGGIAVSRDGQRVAVCDFGNHRVHVFTPEGAHVLTFGQKGSLKGQFINPESVAIDRQGFIFIGDSGNGRVQIFRPDGRFVRAFGNKGSHGGQFSWISGVAVTDQYDVVVSDFKNHCVQIF